MSKLAEKATKAPDKPSVAAMIAETDASVTVIIPKRIHISAIRESNTEKAIPFFTAVPKGDKPGSATFTAIVYDDDGNETQVRFRLGSSNVFVAGR